MDLTTVAVPHTLAHLKPLLPAPPARVLEVGCGRGALAAALADLGYKVTGVDRDAEMAAAARERGVPVIQADVHDVYGEYDVVLFTRSLHHAESLDDILAHAATLLTPDGQVIIEEFAWEQVDHTGAHFLYDNRAMLVATGLLDAELPSGDLLDAWVGGHDFLHQGSAMIAALSRVGSDLTTVVTSILWRLVDGRGGVWIEPAARAADAVNAIREAEERRIAAGMLSPVGLLASVRR
ncbi:Methyltransferase domain-containing protein [Amycolatopsis arida]|uniref:Methyltransferase domain-containing protein n=1 Tax=Amycolatopsis arida TaxID=587909 RepID=A0A1I6A5D8_9PSEU|nr:methyltransferase domain-containing protein [Amycolatopsis arida]TDX88605.1 methyltransferase family protein [Amycolatopsis arida]SFQ63852.1 Methyltransferase domain-containing protein [Amycolatopsis arida]